MIIWAPIMYHAVVYIILFNPIICKIHNTLKIAILYPLLLMRKLRHRFKSGEYLISDRAGIWTKI